MRGRGTVEKREIASSQKLLEGYMRKSENVEKSQLGKVWYHGSNRTREENFKNYGRGKPKDDPYFTKAQWKDVDILPAPKHWGGCLKGGKLPPVPRQIDAATGKPHAWPIRNAIVHWAMLVTAPRPGKYDLRCRTTLSKKLILSQGRDRSSDNIFASLFFYPPNCIVRHSI